MKMNISQDHSHQTSVPSTFKNHFYLLTCDEMQSLDYQVVPHLSKEKLLNCYSEKIYIEITNNTKQMKKGIITKRSISIQRQLPTSC